MQCLAPVGEFAVISTMRIQPKAGDFGDDGYADFC